MTPPELTFFCELETPALEALFADADVITDLVTLKASLSLGILDLSPGRAAVVRRLNEAGIPVIAWQLLPKEQGYWFNLGNAPQAFNRYANFKAWTAEHNLQWAGVGIDIEPDIREAQTLLEDKWRLAPNLLQRLLDRQRLPQAQADYESLVARMRADGYRVDGYLIPPILDERKVGATILKRLAGLVDIPVDREVLMLYTSFLRPRGPGILWSYAPEAQSVGLGNTGGGIDIGPFPDIPPLGWLELARDLRLARRWTDDIHIFCLEGCVRNGFLARLKDFDWDESFAGPPPDSARQVSQFRGALQALLWISANPLLIVAGLFGAMWMISTLRRRIRKR